MHVLLCLIKYRERSSSIPFLLNHNFVRFFVCVCVFYSSMDYSEFDTETLNQMLLHRIREVEQQGVVDSNFRLCHSLKEHSGLFFFLELIPVFRNDVFTVMSEMIKAIEQPAVDFVAMYSHCIKLKGSSACFGACRISEACSRLRKAIDDMSKDQCIQILEELQKEYNTLNDELDSIFQIEREIVSRAT